MFTLRPYQTETIQKARVSISAGNKRIIIHAPTGAGKTIISSEIIRLSLGRNKKVLFLANRRELVFQAFEKLELCGIGAGIIMAGEESNLNLPVQIASMQTYVRRMGLEEENTNPWFHKADLVIVDECHGSISPSWQKILSRYASNVIVIGLTATPCRGDGRGLGEFYEDIIKCSEINELIAEGFLVPAKYYCPSKPDLEKIKTIAGDYDKKELGKRTDTPKLVGDIFENWAKYAGDKKTIIFAVNVKHSLHIKKKFESHGICIEHVDAKTPPEERADILNNLKNGNVQIVTNVGILCEGFDFPAADCIVLARPTKSMGLYLQMAGRGLRIFDNKKEVILLDHGGCVENHGLIEWEREWSLDGKKKAWSDKKSNKTKQPLKCEACNLVFEGSNKCPDCGTEVKSYGKKIDSIDAELQELKKGKETVAEKRRFLGMLKWYIPQQKNNNPKRIFGTFRGRYGVWPHHSYKDVAPIKPDDAFLNYMKYSMIKYIKGQGKNV